MSNEFNPEQSLPVGTQLNLANTTPSEDPQLVHERAMFNKHVQDQGQQTRVKQRDRGVAVANAQFGPP